MIMILYKIFNIQVQRTCAIVYHTIYRNCLINQNLETKILLGYEPLSIIIAGGTDRVSQMTAGMCLIELLNTIADFKDFVVLEEIRKKFIPIFLVSFSYIVVNIWL